MSDDMALVREYAQGNSEQAFATLVSRHVNLVYSVALRQVRDPHLAEEITQSVFIILAGKAKSLGPKTIFSGWLCRTARNVSADTLKIQHRRQFREQEAHMQSILNEPEPGVWNQIAPLLDEALGCLGEKEHDAVVLRFFDGKELKQVGAAMGIGEDAARMRVNRGLEKLREFFTKRGVTLSATAIAGAIAVNSVQAAPAGLAATITAAALSGTTITTAAVIAATKAIAMTTLQKTVIAAAFAVAAGTGIYEARQAANARAEMQTLQQRQTEQVEQMQRNADETARQLALLREENERLNTSAGELLKLRREVTQLKAAATHAQNDTTESAMKSWLSRVSQLKKHLEQMPDKGIPEFQLLTETDWLETVRNVSVDTETEARQALMALRNLAKEKVASDIWEALKGYVKANDGKFPAEVTQLRPYLETPLADSILERYAVVNAADVTNMGLTKSGADLLIAEKTPVDVDYDTRFVIGTVARGRSDYDADILIPVVRAFQTASSGRPLANPSELLPYAQTPEQQRALQKWIQRYPSLPK